MSNIRNNPPRCVMNFHLKEDAIEVYQELYDDITGNGIALTYLERHALGLLSVMMLESELLTQDLYENGEHMTVNGDKGNVVTKKNPARDALEKLRPKIITMLKEFKMTPNSRKADVAQGGSGSSEDDAWNLFD